MNKESFTSQLLKGIQKRANEAHGKAKERFRRATAKRELQEQAKREIEKAQLDADVEKILARSNSKTSSKRKRVTKKTTMRSSSRDGGLTVIDSPHKLAASCALVNHRAPVKVHTSRPPGKLHPNMEYVVRRVREKKKIQVPHTSDYSDMFGDNFWKGIDLKFAKKSAKETADATASNQKILAEQQAERERRNRERDDFYREEKELESKGLLNEREKNKRRLQFSENDWVSVEIPIPIHLQKSSAVARLAQEGSSVPRKARKANVSVGAPATGRITKTESRAELDERAQRLRKQILSISAPTKTPGSKPKGDRRAMFAKGKNRVNRGAQEKKKDRRLEYRISESDNLEREESHTVGKAGRSTSYVRTEMPTRRRPGKRMYDALCESISSDESFRSSSPGKRKRKRRMGYSGSCQDEVSTEVQSGDDECGSDDEDLYDISALDREEARSARIAEIEDKRELERLRRCKREKARRRLECERRRG